MKLAVAPILVGLAILGMLPGSLGAVPALAQAQVQVRATAPAREGQFEIISPGPASREISRPREGDFYREDVRVRHEPAFIEPFTGTPASGPVRRMGLAGWTSPPGHGGSAVVHQEVSGWFGLGFSLVWE